MVRRAHLGDSRRRGMNGDDVQLDGAGGDFLRRSAVVREAQRSGERGEKGNYGFITSSRREANGFGRRRGSGQRQWQRLWFLPGEIQQSGGKRSWGRAAALGIAKGGAAPVATI